MNTDIEVIGESTFIFKVNGINILSDPWFGEPIYGGAWSQFPMPIIGTDQLASINYIYISHVHPDHCCIEAIRKIIKYSPKSKILIMKRVGNICFTSKKLCRHFGEEIRDRIIYMRPYEELELEGIKMWCLPPGSDNSLNEIIDSSLLLSTEDGLILFSNDNLPTTEHANFIEGLGENQYLAMLPFSGGSGYPATYENYNNAEKKEMAETVRLSYEEQAHKFLHKTNFDYFMPVAGNHILVSRSYDYHAKTGFLQNPYEAIERANINLGTRKGIYIWPGEKFEKQRRMMGDEELIKGKKEFRFRKELFIETCSSRMETIIDVLEELSEEEIEKVLSRFGERLNNTLIDIEVEDRKEEPILVICSANIYLKIERNKYEVKRIVDDKSSFNYFMTEYGKHTMLLCVEIKPRLLNAIITKAIHINEADAACLLTYYRTMPYIPMIYETLFTRIY